MRSFIMSLIIPVILLGPVQAGATPFCLINGGSNGTDDKSSIGIEVGGTQVIMNKLPLSAEISLKFTFDDIPSETNFNTNTLNEPYTIKKLNNGPEIGYLFKSGVNLDDVIQNLTLQLGAGYALQTIIPVATGTVSGTHWQQGGKETEVYPVGYGGLLYRLNRICVTAGYHNRRGIVVGVGSNW
jgi:hypothetical protein